MSESTTASGPFDLATCSLCGGVVLSNETGVTAHDTFHERVAYFLGEPTYEPIGRTTLTELSLEDFWPSMAMAAEEQGAPPVDQDPIAIHFRDHVPVAGPGRWDIDPTCRLCQVGAEKLLKAIADLPETCPHGQPWAGSCTPCDDAAGIDEEREQHPEDCCEVDMNGTVSFNLPRGTVREVPKPRTQYGYGMGVPGISLEPETLRQLEQPVVRRANPS